VLLRELLVASMDMAQDDGKKELDTLFNREIIKINSKLVEK
jgi:hypothetical protein